jgi:hypothetical protein
MNMEPLSAAEQEAVSAVASLAGKRNRSEDSPDAAGGFKVGKVARQEPIAPVAMGPPLPPPAQAVPAPVVEPAPYPFFHYKDYSTKPDPDELTPLTPPGRVPNFPAKMHSILSRPDLADVICWMPHGRSWRVLKPREFEIRVIPTYFEHAKFSSFIRQANGWGFRRITQGRDRNSYYHELFMRGLPHLCKDMKRPGVAMKQAADPEHEPDFYKIAEQLPVPEKAEDDSIILQCTLTGGPKARMPIYSGFASAVTTFEDSKPAPVATAVPQLTPRDQQALSAFQQSLGASESQMKHLSVAAAPPAVAQPQQVYVPPTAFYASQPNTLTLPAGNAAMGGNKMHALAAANELAFSNPNMAAAFQASSAASQFAAGFAAATALSHQQLRTMLGSMGIPPQDQMSMGVPPQDQPPQDQFEPQAMNPFGN